MTPERLSALTWTVDDRRAWLAAYQAARRIDRARRRRARAASDRFAALAGSAREQHEEYSARRESMHSVHVDRLPEGWR